MLCTEANAFRPHKQVFANNRLQGTTPAPTTSKSSLPKACRQAASPMFVSATLEEEGAENEQKTVANSGTAPNNEKKVPEMPWSDLHAFALRDNLPRYTRALPGKTPQSYALWRTMMQDVPELSGYPIEFLREKSVSALSGEGTESSSEKKSSETSAPDVLPYLDNFYFEPSGGLSGQVYGVAGLKDGTKIETSSVGQVEVTIPLGYVLTETEGIAYELGKPLSQQEDGGYILDGISGITNTAGSFSQQAVATMGDAMTQRGTTPTVGSKEGPNAMLVSLGAYTGVLLAGATAMSMLSHHLTVNVFWV